MVNARLHIICGNCGSKEFLTYHISEGLMCDNEGCERDGVVIACSNCATLHALDDTIKESE